MITNRDGHTNICTGEFIDVLACFSLCVCIITFRSWNYSFICHNLCALINIDCNSMKVHHLFLSLRGIFQMLQMSESEASIFKVFLTLSFICLILSTFFFLCLCPFLLFFYRNYCKAENMAQGCFEYHRLNLNSCPKLDFYIFWKTCEWCLCTTAMSSVVLRDLLACTL